MLNLTRFHDLVVELQLVIFRFVVLIVIWVVTFKNVWEASRSLKIAEFF